MEHIKTIVAHVFVDDHLSTSFSADIYAFALCQSRLLHGSFLSLRVSCCRSTFFVVSCISCKYVISKAKNKILARGQAHNIVTELITTFLFLYCPAYILRGRLSLLFGRLHRGQRLRSCRSSDRSCRLLLSPLSSVSIFISPEMQKTNGKRFAEAGGGARTRNVSRACALVTLFPPFYLRVCRCFGGGHCFEQSLLLVVWGASDPIVTVNSSISAFPN